MLSRGGLRLVLSAPTGPNTGGGSALPDGRKPTPGGWNRFAIQVDDITDVTEMLRRAGVQSRSGEPRRLPSLLAQAANPEVGRRAWAGTVVVRGGGARGIALGRRK